MRRLILSSALASAFVAAAPAFAQVYKWVDDKGVVNYSNEAPANRSSKLLDPKSAKVSTYTPDEALKQTPGPVASLGERVLSEKIDRLERKLDAERAARQLADVQAQTVADARYQQCVRDRRVDCDSGMDPYYDPYYYAPYGVPIVVARHHFRPRQVANHRHAAGPKPVTRSASSSGRMGLPRQM
jgi:uncharacterized protein DUF4124